MIATGPMEVSIRDRDLQRANGIGRVVLDGTNSGTHVLDIYQKFPTRIMFPTVADNSAKEAVLVNTAGGIAGGDRFELEITARGCARVTATSQAAEKVYRALDQQAEVVTRLKVSETAKLAWLPQETIVFNSARIHRRMEVDIGSGAELMALEWLVLGRGAYGEEVSRGHIRDTWRVRLDGKLVWADSFLVTDETFPHLSRKALLINFRTIGTLLFFGTHLDRRLEMLRSLAGRVACTCAATIVNGLMIVRLAARKPQDVRSGLVAILQCFGQEDVSGPFRVPKMWSC
jgi:urease accessory protein